MSGPEDIWMAATTMGLAVSGFWGMIPSSPVVIEEAGRRARGLATSGGAW